MVVDSVHVSPPAPPPPPKGTLKPQKEIPECCMEAALYCRRSYVEDRMPIEARQRNVVYVVRV